MKSSKVGPVLSFWLSFEREAEAEESEDVAAVARERVQHATTLRVLCNATDIRLEVTGYSATWTTQPNKSLCRRASIPVCFNC